MKVRREGSQRTLPILQKKATGSTRSGAPSMNNEYRHRSLNTTNAQIMVDESDHTRPGQSSAMVVVLGLVSLLSLVIGILIGLLF